ncbi:hypothetical protein K0M31_016721 [Melipona bicolor]|uniref:Uncharacterized protein n=1 Tax=Melipona bicolor TaxID=60889 RepID=A0AA40KEG0_9HYME|nr:hypothetical protein K0M31_016721 [Melipona bicolor]
MAEQAWKYQEDGLHNLADLQDYRLRKKSDIPKPCTDEEKTEPGLRHPHTFARVLGFPPPTPLCRSRGAWNHLEPGLRQPQRACHIGFRDSA